MVKLQAFLFLCCICFSSAYAGSVWLLNDAPYTLTATVKSADGTVLGSVTVKAGQQNSWVTSLSPQDLNSQYEVINSSTPYTVTWQCEHGGFYSFCVGVSPGGLVTANQCEGAHYCQPPPKKDEKSDCNRCCECDDQKK